MSLKWGPNRIFDAEALRKPLGGILERSWRLLEPKKVSLEASWNPLGVLKIAPRCPDRDREEVGGRSTDHVSLAMAPGECHYQRLSIKNNDALWRV